MNEDINPEKSMRNVVDIGEALKPGLAILERIAKESSEFCKRIREQVDKDGIVGHCIEHDSSQLEVDWERTFGMTRKNGNLTVEFKECPICIVMKKSASEKIKWLDMGIPQSLLGARFLNFDTSEPDSEDKLRVLRRFKHQCEKENGFLICCGSYGTGKSHLAVSAIYEMGGGRFVTEHDLIGELRQTYSDNTGPDEMLDKYKKAKVLVLDEITPEVKGVDIPPLLYRVLGYRHDAELLTIITSNESLEVVLQILGPKLSSRINVNYQIANFAWDDYRQRK